MAKSKNVTTAKEMAYKYIYKNISRGHLQPGERLKSRNIAAELGLSHAPVREAIMNLASQGFLEYGAHSGAKVLDIDIQEVRQHMELRTLVEPYAAGEAACLATPKQLDEIRSCFEEMEKFAESLPGLLVSGSDNGTIFERSNEIDKEFHTAVLNASNNKALMRYANYSINYFHLYIVAWYRQPWDREKFINNVKTNVRTHGPIMQHIIERDPVKAAQAMRDSLEVGVNGLGRWQRGKRSMAVHNIDL